jgi:hypothetical protein
MKLIRALFTHAWLAIRLKHDGIGMPKKLPAAAVLIALYIALNLVNKSLNDGIDANTLIGLSFVAQFYLFGLRNEMMGLVVMISVVINFFTLALTTLTGIPESNLFILLILEYVMIFAAVINVIKTNAKIV